MLIQFLLIAGILVVLLSFLRNRNALHFRAGKKLLFVLFVLASTVSVLRPDALTSVAGLVGVGRGADLLLYALIVAFAFVVINVYLKFRDNEDRMTLLARRIALLEAVQRAEQRDDSR